MKNNDILRRLRYILNINDLDMMKIFSLSGFQIDLNTLLSYLKKEDEEGYIYCIDAVMNKFLDGLIIFKRGKFENKNKKVIRESLNNNIVLKKLRIAFELKEKDILDILKSVDMKFSKNELSAIFRRKGHRNYKECQDQILRKFLRGLAIK